MTKTQLIALVVVLMVVGAVVTTLVYGSPFATPAFH